MNSSKNEKDGRKNIGLVNQVTKDILEHALLSKNKYLSMGDLAAEIRHHYNLDHDTSKKMSAEYKQINKLLPHQMKTGSRFRFKTPGFFHVKKNGCNKTRQRVRIYAPNFRGLLLYLYLCKLPNLRIDSLSRNNPGKIKGNDDRENSSLGKRKYNQTISKIQKIISKPSVQEETPFLKYWNDFQECGFNVIELLLDIAKELYNQRNIDAENDNYLIRRATERYFVQVENYCYERLDDRFYSEFLVRTGKITYDRLNTLAEIRHRYRKHLIPIQKEWIQSQLKVINDIDNDRLRSDIARETSLYEGKTILLNDLEKKYNTSLDVVSKALGLYYSNDPHVPYYYPSDGKKYLVTNTCLISVHEIDKLKPVLCNGMNFDNVCSLFLKYGIPETCHLDLIRKLGFEIIRMPGEKWNDSRKWFIVEIPLSNIESFFRRYLQ